MDKILSPFRQGKTLNTLFWANIFVSFHYALIIYINSSFLSTFFTETQVSALYIVGSILDAMLLLNASRILQKLGNFKFTILAIFVELLSTLGLMFSINPFIVSLSFLTHVFTISLLLFNMDVYVEGASTDESKTSSIRATYLTITSTTIVIAPAIVSMLVKNSSYTYVYLLSSLFLLPMFYFVTNFKKIKTQQVDHINPRETLLEYTKDSNLYDIFICQSLLQLFYSYMVIYVPIYLSKYIGFSWAEIGMIFTIMLLPFVLFELPVGELEDYKYGEKEFLTIGLVILGLSTIFMSFVTVKVFWIWATMLFISRVGASFVEVSSESYFFKHVDQNKTNVISFFRISRPLSFIITPILATVIMQFIPFQFVFIAVGIIMIVGTRYSLSLEDTK